MRNFILGFLFAMVLFQWLIIAMLINSIMSTYTPDDTIQYQFKQPQEFNI